MNVLNVGKSLQNKKCCFIEMPGEYNAKFKTERTLDQSISPGSKYVIEVIKKEGINLDVFLYPDIPKLKSYDYIFMSFMFVRQYLYIFPFFFKARIHPDKNKRTQQIIIGGHGLHNPYPLRRFFNAAIIGDGEQIIKEFINDPSGDIPGVYRFKKGEKVEKQYYKNFCDNAVVYQYGNNIPYIEISRGCRSKCFFCEFGWTHTYRHGNRNKIYKSIDKIEGKRIHFMGADESDEKDFGEYIKYADGKGLKTKFSSSRLDTIQQGAKCMRFGVEGLTEKYRKFFGKGIKEKHIIEGMRKAIDGGCTRFKFFYIIGVGETEKDWKEFFKFIGSLKFSKHFFLEMSLTTFIPKPGTPMESYPGNLFTRKGWRYLKENCKTHKSIDSCTCYSFVPTPALQQFDTFLFWCPDLYKFLGGLYKNQSRIEKLRSSSQELDYKRLANWLGFDWEGVLSGDKRDQTVVINPYERQKEMIKKKNFIVSRETLINN